MKREWKPGDVHAVVARGKVRLIRYLPDPLDMSRLPWVMDPTYDRDDYIHSNWRGDEPELRPLAVLDPTDRPLFERLTSLFIGTGVDRHLPLRTHAEIADALQAAVASLVEPEKPRCSAHGDEQCLVCSRIESSNLRPDGECSGCESYGVDGMHWDTCPARIRGTVYGSRAAAMMGEWSE